MSNQTRIRIPVPDGFDEREISMAGTDDFYYGMADVNLDDRPHARNIKLTETDDGTIGVHRDVADAVAEYLGTEPLEEPITQGSDAEEAPSDDPEPATATDPGPDFNGDTCPWCGAVLSDDVRRHAQTAHSDQWADYRASGF